MPLRFPGAFRLLLLPALAGVARAAESAAMPLWAYGVTRPAEAGEKAPATWTAPSRKLRANEDEAEQTRPRSVEGSSAHYSLQDVRDHSHVIDWFPEDHPPMTDVLRLGPAKLRPNFGCASCHLPNGRGRPENAPVAGQSVGYFVRQLQDFRDGRRTSADPRKPNVVMMAALAAAMTDAEMHEAAEYFAKIAWKPWVRVVETELVPRTRIVNNLFLPLETQRTEPLGARIIEVPEDESQSELLRNPRSSFVAYVPVGSIARGRKLATTERPAPAGLVPPVPSLACATCHGPDLQGLGEVPAIAGRSPSYLARQLYDFQSGTRKGQMAALMQPVVAGLTNDDLVALSAYVASLAPTPPNAK